MLLASTTMPLSGRAVASRLGLSSHDGVRKVLERLVEHGLVHRQAAGGALLHTLNREHLAAAAVLALADIRSSLWVRIHDLLTDWALAPVHASVFGSAARGDGGTASDIDLFLVRPAAADGEDERWRGQVDELTARVQAWTGNPLTVLEQPEQELPQLVAADLPVLEDLRRDAVHLIGPPVRELLPPSRAS